MKLLLNCIILLIDRFILQKSNGASLKRFAEHMGIAYIKLAQILAMQNIGNIFTEDDRQDLLHICDDCNRVPFKYVDKVLREDYGDSYFSIIKKIRKKPIGSASVSQVHYGTLTNGDKVVFKIKRKDIANNINHDIAVIKRLMKYGGWVIGFGNKTGGQHALGFYEKWILEEVDFKHEVDNILHYTRFAKSVNGKLKGEVNIEVPKVYTEYCTENIIVMEYIPYKTISRMDESNKDKIIKGISSYIRLSFWALFNGSEIVFHGDPHAGNIYITDEGNIGFLDMGLIFALTPENANNVRQLFFCAYFGNYDKLIEILRPVFYGTDKEFEAFEKDVKLYCKMLHTRPLTAFFMDLVWVCYKYDIAPMDFLYGMAKAFVCLSGIDIIYDNIQTGHDLLRDQVFEYLVDKTSVLSKELIDNTFNGLKALATCDRDSALEALVHNVELLNTIKDFRF